MHLAAEKGHTACVSKLVEDADLEIASVLKNERRWTALHLACANGHAAAVALLVDAMANLRAEVETWGHRPLHLAQG